MKPERSTRKIVSKNRVVRDQLAQRCSNTLRERQNFCVLDSNDETNFVGSPPSCSHGPCLLFGRRSDSGDLVESFFGCAVYRSDRGCNFRMPLQGQPQHNSDSIKKSGIDFSNTKQRVSASPVHKHRLLSESHSRESTSQFSTIDDEKKTSIVNKPRFIYGIIRKHVNQLIAIGVPLYYCSYCNDAVRIPHKHPVVGPLRRHHFRKPSALLKAITEDDGEAQYWFNDESLRVIVNVLRTVHCDGVLCIGAPTLFEFIRRNQQMRMEFKSFLLDIDARLMPFYLSKQFAQFSMLTGHFYDSNSTRKFESFLKSVKNLIIVCDPPFGIMVEALFRTIRQLKDKFVNVHQKESYRINLILVMPLFVGKHVKECDDSMEMVDYKICYVNHSKYAKPQKSIVRFFTDLPLKQFVLPTESGYRFCEMCERYVANENRHCGLCGICPSKDGTSYRHCARCNRCVKCKYLHCSKCGRCHLAGRCLET